MRPDRSLGGRRENRLLQARRFDQALRQRNAAHSSRPLILLPTGTDEIAPDDALHRRRGTFLNQHGASLQPGDMRSAGHGKLIGFCRDQVIGYDVFHHFEPVFRQRRKDYAFARNRCGEDDVERRNAIAGDEQELVIKIVNVTDFTSVKQS